MSKKFSTQRKRAFLTYLAETGNQTLSAERAKVSRSWVCLHRSTDAEFDAACRDSIARARESLEGVDTNGAPARWRYFDGHELVVREAGGFRVQIGRARVKQWTRRVEQRFLSTLAATCNVTAACAEAGMEKSGAYGHRYRSPEFAKAWDEAVELGYVRVEAALVENACNLHSPAEDPPDIDMPPVTFDQALHLLNRHKHQVRGIGKRPGRAQRMATDAEVRRALVRSLRAFGVRVTQEDLRGDDE